jgi:hypothetical protein
VRVWGVSKSSCHAVHAELTLGTSHRTTARPDAHAYGTSAVLASARSLVAHAEINFGLVNESFV